MLPYRSDDLASVGDGMGDGAADAVADEAVSVPGHAGRVAGRSADGGLTDESTDVRTQSDRRYVAYVPRCECGWTGPPFSPTSSGFVACRRLWRTKHLELFLRARDPRPGWWSPTVIRGRGLGC